MPTVLYLRGVPGTGKNVVARILERDLKWPRLWVHQLDSLFKIIGDYKVPSLTDKIMRDVSNHIMQSGRDFMVVRPSRQARALDVIKAEADKFGYRFIPVQLTASYDNLVTRVTRRWAESPFRLTTKDALDEYLGSRKAEAFDGEHLIDTDNLTPEEVAAKVRELL